VKVTGTVKQERLSVKGEIIFTDTLVYDLDIAIDDLGVMLEGLLPPIKAAPKKRGKKADAPEEQTEPVDAETAAKDDADEAGERESDEVTVDDVRESMLRLATRVGYDNVVKKLQSIIGAKLEDLETEDQCKAAIDALEAATNEPATKDELMEALREYALLYDGQCDKLPEAKFTCADIPRVLKKAVGVEALSQVAEKDLAKAVVAVRSATGDNPFKRKRVGVEKNG